MSSLKLLLIVAAQKERRITVTDIQVTFLKALVVHVTCRCIFAHGFEPTAVPSGYGSRKMGVHVSSCVHQVHLFSSQIFKIGQRK
eukprot:1916150-Amphidinium_carterae.1